MSATETDSTLATPALSYEDHALKALRNAGYRITMPRVQVIRALADTSKALSAYAIHKKIHDGGGKIDPVSVYRILVTLQECKLVDHIGVVDGYYPRRDETGSPFAYVVNEEGTVSVLTDLTDIYANLRYRAEQVLGTKIGPIKIEMVEVKA